ncbi:MAG: FeoA family protein [Pseudomonadota bacterium]
MSTLNTIRMMKKGQKAVIKKIVIDGELGRRIRDMGLLPGKTIQVVGRAPLRDPVELKLTDCALTLRNNEADHIVVELLEGC